MDTPITVSSSSTVPNKSDFLQLNYSPASNEKSIISLGSTSFERVPVSWRSNQNAFTRSDSNTTLSNIQKVNNWINSIEEPKHDSLVVDFEADIKKSKFSDGSNAETIKHELNSDSKSVILFRCDFNKTVSNRPCCSPLKTVNRSTSLLNYLKSEKRETSTFNPNISNSTTRKSYQSNADKKNIQKDLLLKLSESTKYNYFNPSYNRNNRTNEVDKTSVKMNDEKSDGSSIYEVPLSPESRKKELCSYLQLMNPADKKERFILQNRRSTRVRNLTAMQEKKKKFDGNKVTHNEESEHLTKDVEKCPTLKSFRELNIKVEKTKLNQENQKTKFSENEVEKDVFCFPFPSEEFTEDIKDFEDTMSKLVSRYRRICRIKNIKLNSKIGFTKSVPRKKESHVKNNIKNKLSHKTDNIQKKKPAININKLENKNNKKMTEIKTSLKRRYEASRKSSTPRSNSLRSTGKLKNISLKKLIRKKEDLLNKRSLRKKALREQKNIEKTAQPCGTGRRISVVSSESNSKIKVKCPSPQCEIITIPKTSEDNQIDIENLMDDMIDFNNLSEEHKKCLIESRILSTKDPRITSTSITSITEQDQSFYSIQSMSPLYGFNKEDVNEVNKICEIYKNCVLKSTRAEVAEEFLFGTNEVKIEENETNDENYKTEAISAIEQLASSSVDGNFEPEFIDANDNRLEVKNSEANESSTDEPITNGNNLQEHDYAGLPSDDEEDEELEGDVDVVSIPNSIPNNNLLRNFLEIKPRSLLKTDKFELVPYNKTVEMKSLHKSLQYVKKKNDNTLQDQSFAREWDSDSSSKPKSKKQSHYISINKQNGAVLKAFYIDFNLIVCQENIVSFWMQTPLGNVLGSQNMWIPRGQTQRLVLNGKCMQKESMEMVITMETYVAFIELWTKEHKSDIREGPVADVFATVYFWKQRQNGLDKKVLQLENINGFADDVQYSVMKSVPKIIVSWHSANEDTATKRTFIHAYELAQDFQTVANIYNIEPVDHYVSSLHNIEDCDSLIMGCGENKITLWNLEYGYIIATIELTEIKSPLSTLWVKCDRGFLFALQQCVDRELRLIAINGMNHSWKKLASYIPPEGFDRLRGVCIENGLLLSFYDQGILCWKAETGEPIEETNVESEIIPSGKYVIIMEDDQLLVKHAMTHLMSVSADES